MDEHQIQKQIQQYWCQHNIREQSISRNKCYPKVTIYDGPPFPTGPPHHGHMMTSTVKDTVIRYLMATGHYVPRQLGWDMYGPNNPPTNQIEQHIQTWNKTLDYLGRWTDGERYRTSNPEYVQSVWWVFKTLWNKGHLRIGYGLTPYCISCDMYYSDFERHQQSCSVVEQTIYYRIPVRCTSCPEIKALLVWEMWPWTLVAVTGYAIADINDYNIDERGTLMSKYYKLTGTPVSTSSGKIELEALNPITNTYVPVYVSSKVASNKGTGIVRLSPHMDSRSCDILDELPDTELEPELISSEFIIQLLDLSGFLVERRQLKRTDSACPRCSKRLITYPCHGIYYNIRNNRIAIARALEQIYWEPKSSKGRILRYLNNANDWLISRKTRPGIAIPIWQPTGSCPGAEPIVIGSYAELREYGLNNSITGQDTPTFDYMGTEYQRMCYQFDNWFDSACMPYGSVGYPFACTKMELVHSLFPCLLAIEGVDQIYGWFLTTNIISSSLFNGPAFKNIITNGLVLDNNIKMSKSKSKPKSESESKIDSTVIDAICEYGADTYRVYLMQNRLLSGIDFNYEPSKITNHFTRGILGAYQLIKKYSDSDTNVNIKFRPTRITNITDNWILQALDNYLEKYHELMSVFKVAKTLSISTNFLGSIKKYIHYNRNRLGSSDTISISVIVRVFYYYLLTVAPFVPHITEHLYLELLHENWIPDLSMSIHMCQIPKKQWRINKTFLRSSDVMFQIIDLINKTPSGSQRIRVYIHDITLIRGVDGYISEVTGKDIIYSSGLSTVLRGIVTVHYHKMFEEQDKNILGSLSLEQIIELERTGYYRTINGIKTYPGQYSIKYEPIINVPVNYCGSGVLIQVIDNKIAPSESLVDSREVIIKGQIIGRRLHREIQKSGRSIIYLEHPVLSEITDERAKVLISNINRYTLPIINQSIYNYQSSQKAFKVVEICVFSVNLYFHLVTIDSLLNVQL